MGLAEKILRKKKVPVDPLRAAARQGPVISYEVTRRIFLRGLGLVYCIAFASLAVQVKGLYGQEGITPISDFPRVIQERMGADSFLGWPTLFWFTGSDTALHAVCWGGVALAIVLMLGLFPAPVLILLWFLYLSITNAGDVFMSFQWDILLLETGFLAIFLAPWTARLRSPSATPPSRIILFLLRWLLFRLMFLSGIVKLTAGDPVWPQLTALQYHYETQPLPTWIGWYLHQLPGRFHELSTAVMFAVELILPFFILGTLTMRMIAVAGIASLMMIVGLSGNYNFFNLLTVLMCVPLLDDSVWARLIKVKRRVITRPKPAWSGILWGRRVVHGALAAGIVLLSIYVALPGLKLPVAADANPAGWDTNWNHAVQSTAKLYEPIEPAIRKVRPYRITSAYGLFRHMTKRRPEIVIEGSDDGLNWKELEFRWKPGDLSTAPRFCEPHQPRLDWQMWFAALGRKEMNPWFTQLMHRILEGSEPVLDMFEKNPFQATAPRYVRAVLFEYKFTDVQTRHATGHWWRREQLGLYCPPIWLSDGPAKSANELTTR